MGRRLWIILMIPVFFFPVSAGIADIYETCGANLTWILNEGTLLISGTGNMTDYDDEQAPPWYEYKDAITTIILSDGVASIGSYAFADCDRVGFIRQAGTIKQIGAYAFQNCISLTEINLPEDLREIGTGAFEDCSGLETVILPESLETIDEWAFSGCDRLTEITIPDRVQSIGRSSFYSTDIRYAAIGSNGAKALSKAGYSFMITGNPNILLQYIYENNVLAGLQAEAANTSITEAVIPEHVTLLRKDAFKGCSGLMEIVIPGSISIIPENTFEGCENLTEVTIQSGVEQIRSMAFHDCWADITIRIPDSVTAIDQHAFPVSRETLVVGCRSYALDWAKSYPYDIEGVDFPCYRIFHEMVSDEAIAPTCEEGGLSEGSHCTVCGMVVTAQEALDALGHDWGQANYAWNDDHSEVTATRICHRDAAHLETETVSATAEITKSPSETTDGQRTYISAAFENAAFAVQTVIADDLPALSTLNMLRMPASTRMIEDEAFEGGAFQGVVIPDGCVSIGSKAFANCEQLLYVSIPVTVKEVSDDAFMNSKLAVIDRR